VEKDRLRFLVRYQGIEFFINIDSVSKPELGHFLEIKSRTWSQKDAEAKSRLTTDLIELLGASPTKTISEDYLEMIWGK
jgi:5-methylthioadenosine/S-adenosylhomocysteine deaminase